MEIIKNKKTSITLRLLSVVVATIIFANTAFALGQITITVKNPDPYKGNHSWFMYEKEAGEAIEDTASIRNFGKEPALVKIYAVDATSNKEGSFILTFLEEEQKGIGEWTEIESKSITINPNETVDIPFKILIPKGVTPGNYLGGLVIENDTISSENGTGDCDEDTLCGTNISVKARIGTRIYLTVPGETHEEYYVDDFSATKTITGVTKFKFKIINNGNIAYEPLASIEVFDNLGNLYERIDKKIGTSSPGTVTYPEVQMEKRPIAGNFTAKATVYFQSKFGNTSLHGSSESISQSIQFFVMPWEILGVMLIIGIFIILLILKRAHAFKKYEKEGKNYTLQSCENLISISEKRGINWKKVAKFNKLKPPYILKEGDTIILPKK